MSQQDDQVSFNFGGDAKPTTGGFEPIPVGKYRCVCEKIETGLTNNNDKKWTAFLRIVEGPQSNRMLFDRVAFNEKSQNFVFSFFRAFGFDTQPGGQITARQSDIIGRVCIVEVYGHTKGNNNKTYEDIILLPDTGPQSPQAAPPRAEPAPQTYQQGNPQGYQQPPATQQAAPPPLPQQYSQQPAPQPVPQQGFGQGAPIPVNPPEQQPAPQGEMKPPPF